MKARRRLRPLVYLTTPRLDGAVKIGFTKQLEKRMYAVGREIGQKVVSQFHIDSPRGRWLESYLHLAFGHRRVKGEWFRLSDDEVALIRSIPTAKTHRDLPPAIVALHRSNGERRHEERARVVAVSNRAYRLVRLASAMSGKRCIQLLDELLIPALEGICREEVDRRLFDMGDPVG